MNKIDITGRLGKDPELKTGANGNEYVKFTVAVNRRKVKDQEQKTDWFNCSAFGKTAAAISKYFKKGDGILLGGRMESDEYEDKSNPGKKLHSWALIVETFEFPLSKPNGSAKAENEDTIDEDCPF